MSVFVVCTTDVTRRSGGSCDYPRGTLQPNFILHAHDHIVVIWRGGACGADGNRYNIILYRTHILHNNIVARTHRNDEPLSDDISPTRLRRELRPKYNARSRTHAHPPHHGCDGSNV